MRRGRPRELRSPSIGHRGSCVVMAPAHPPRRPGREDAVDLRAAASAKGGSPGLRARATPRSGASRPFPRYDDRLTRGPSRSEIAIGSSGPGLSAVGRWTSSGGPSSIGRRRLGMPDRPGRRACRGQTVARNPGARRMRPRRPGGRTLQAEHRRTPRCRCARRALDQRAVHQHERPRRRHSEACRRAVRPSYCGGCRPGPPAG